MFLDDDDFSRQFDDRVLPLIALGKDGYFEGVDGARIYHMAFNNPEAKAKVIIVPGFTENTIKYRELIYNFYQAGYSVYIFDPRSQGKSTRFLPDKGRIWVKHWRDYVSDLKTFIHKIVPQDGLPAVIFSHSMGGAIVADALTSEPNLVKAAVISSPIITLNTGKYPGFLAFLPKSIVYALVFLGLGRRYSAGQRAFDAEAWTLLESSTSSAPRHERYKRDVIAAGEQMGGASYNWVREVLKMNRRLANPDVVAKVTTPILMGQAGKDDLAVASGQMFYCSLAQNCRLSVKDHSKHEIYNEIAAIRNPWILEILAFYDEQLGRAGEEKAPGSAVF